MIINEMVSVLEEFCPVAFILFKEILCANFYSAPISRIFENKFLYSN
jgi:hypothetical protein